MIRRLRIGAAVLGVALVLAAKAPQTVDEIVARHVAARGGLAKLRAIDTLRQTGTVSAGPGREARVIRELKRPGKTRFEFTVQGVTGVYVSDGEKGWQVSPFDGGLEPRPLDDEVVREAAEQADFEGPLVDWKAKGHTVALAGRTQVGGRDAYDLEVTLASGAVRHEYLDAHTFQLVRSDSTRTVRGRPVKIEATFAEFKKAGGVVFPRRIEIAAAGRPGRLLIEVDEIAVNPPLGDARFR